MPCVENLHDMNSIALDSRFIGRYVPIAEIVSLDCCDTRYVQNAETVFDGMYRLPL